MGFPSHQESRRKIVEAAKLCLRRYGPDKLAVTDVARSLGMSHANVYRFFKSKSSLLDAIIDEWLTWLENFIDEIAARPLPAAQRLELVVLELHRKRKQKFLEDAEIFEVFKRVAELRPEVLAKRREKITRVFERLLVDGIQSGEFKAHKPKDVAIALKDATSLFLHPFLIPTNVGDDTELRAKNVVRYLLAGFRNQPHRPASAKRATRR